MIVTVMDMLFPDNENLKTASESLDFVNKVRDDLRRNNDDYTLLEGHNQLQQASAPAPRQPARQRGSRTYSRRGNVGADLAPAPLNDGKQTNQSDAGFRSFKHLRNMRVSKLIKRLNRDKNMLRTDDPQPEMNTEVPATITQPTTTPTRYHLSTYQISPFLRIGNY